MTASKGANAATGRLSSSDARAQCVGPERKADGRRARERGLFSLPDDLLLRIFKLCLFQPWHDVDVHTDTQMVGSLHLDLQLDSVAHLPLISRRTKPIAERAIGTLVGFLSLNGLRSYVRRVTADPVMASRCLMLLAPSLTTHHEASSGAELTMIALPLLTSLRSLEIENMPATSRGPLVSAIGQLPNLTSLAISTLDRGLTDTWAWSRMTVQELGAMLAGSKANLQHVLLSRLIIEDQDVIALPTLPALRSLDIDQVSNSITLMPLAIAAAPHLRSLAWNSGEFGAPDDLGFELLRSLITSVSSTLEAIELSGWDQIWTIEERGELMIDLLKQCRRLRVFSTDDPAPFECGWTRWPKLAALAFDTRDMASSTAALVGLCSLIASSNRPDLLYLTDLDRRPALQKQVEALCAQFSLKLSKTFSWHATVLHCDCWDG